MAGANEFADTSKQERSSFEVAGVDGGTPEIRKLGPCASAPIILAPSFALGTSRLIDGWPAAEGLERGIACAR